MSNEKNIKSLESKGWERDSDSLIFFKNGKWYGVDLSQDIQLFDVKKGMTFKTCDSLEECRDLL